MTAAAVAATATPSAVTAPRIGAGAKPAAKAADGAASFDQALGAAGDTQAADDKATQAKAADTSTKPKPDTGASKDSDSPDKSAGAKADASGVVSWLVNLIGGQPAAASAAAAVTAQADAKPAVIADCKALPVTAKAGKAAAPVPTLPLLPGTDDAAGDDAAEAAPAVAKAPIHAEVLATPAAHAQADALPAAADSSTQTPLAATLQFAQVLDRTAGDSSSIQAQPAAAQSHTALPQDRDAWAETLSDQVRWQVGNDVREARLELHPRDLGSVQVQVRVTSEGTEVRFAAEHPQAREALQQALPQLRSLLAGDGQLLSQAQVGSQSQSSRQFNMPFQSSGGNTGGDDSADDSGAVSLPQIRHIRIGLLDDFA